MVGRFWKPYIGQAVDGELNLMVPIDGAEELAAIQLEMSIGTISSIKFSLPPIACF
jgi:hypothetical protein